MNFGGIFRFAIDNVVKSFSKFLISVSLISICMLISIIVFFSYLGSGYSYNSLNDVLNSGVSGTGVLLFLHADSPRDAQTAFLSEVHSLDNVESIGSLSLGGTQGLESLAKIQEENSNRYSVQAGGIPEILYLNYDVLDLCELKVEQGTVFEELEQDEGIRHLYLGSGFKGKVGVGDKYETDGLTFVVSGILEKNSNWVDIEILNGYTSQKIDYTYPLEYAVVMIEFGPPSMSSVLFSVCESSEMEETIAQISQLAKDSDLNISIQTLDELYQEDSADLVVMRSYILRMFTIVIISTVIIVSCLQINTIISDKRMYGIYYANGMSRKDLQKIIVLEVLIKAIVSLVLSGSIGAMLAKWWFKLSELNLLLNQIYFVQTLPKVSVVALVVVVLSTVVPLWTVRNYTPRELMGGKDDLFR